MNWTGTARQDLIGCEFGAVIHTPKCSQVRESPNRLQFFRVWWFHLQLFARLFFVRLYRGRPHIFGFVRMELLACQQEINDSQHKHYESIDKHRVISQHDAKR